MDVVRALIRVHGLKVRRMAHDLEALADAVAAVHVASLAGDVQRLAAVVALDDADHLWRGLGLVHQASHLQRGLKPQRDLGLHIGEFLLKQPGPAVSVHSGAPKPKPYPTSKFQDRLGYR